MPHHGWIVVKIKPEIMKKTKSATQWMKSGITSKLTIIGISILCLIFIAGSTIYGQELSIQDFKFDGEIGSSGAKIEKIGKNHFRVILGHAPNKENWSNTLQFEITNNARGNNLRLNVEFPVEDARFKFNGYYYSWSYDKTNWNTVFWRKNHYGGENTDVLVFPTFTENRVYIGRQVPMSHQMLEEMITEWQKNQLVRAHVIGKSLEGRNIYRVEVGDDSKVEKKWVHYFNNQHPGEHNAQWRMVGMMEWLLSEDGLNYAKENIHHFVFMMSPDAPSNGWYRTNKQGVDMNRSYFPRGSDPEQQAHEAYVCQKDLEDIMKTENPVNTLWSMHTWPGAVEMLITPGPEFESRVGSVTDLKELFIKNDTLSWIEPLKTREFRPNSTHYWTDGPHFQFGITVVLVEGAGNIHTKQENIYTGKILMKSIAEFYN
jgi:hypothetical protein